MIIVISVHVSNFKIVLPTGTGFIDFVEFEVRMVITGQLKKLENKVITYAIYFLPNLNEMLL